MLRPRRGRGTDWPGPIYTGRRPTDAGRPLGLYQTRSPRAGGSNRNRWWRPRDARRAIHSLKRPPRSDLRIGSGYPAIRPMRMRAGATHARRGWHSIPTSRSASRTTRSADGVHARKASCRGAEFPERSDEGGAVCTVQCDARLLERRLKLRARLRVVGGGRVVRGSRARLDERVEVGAAHPDPATTEADRLQLAAIDPVFSGPAEGALCRTGDRG